MMANSRLVYSTETGSSKKEPASGSSWQKHPGPAKIRLESKGRGGKTVTVIFNLPLSEDEARDFLRTMQTSFGCGGALKDNAMELRGDVRTKVESYFAGKNIKLIRAGG